MPIRFPPVTDANADGLLAVGGTLTVDNLKTAYKNGIFPWPVEGYPLLWFAPEIRAVLDFNDFKIPKRLARELKKSKFTFKVNGRFNEVIRACAKSKNRKGQKGTWITPEMEDAYLQFHEAGFAVSFEAYDANDKLVGGMYGVNLGKFFAGESMFYRTPNASKFVLIQTVNALKKCGIEWMDIQMLTPLLQTFGAKEIPRDEFMLRLKRALAGGIKSVIK